jgi:hypothetical protein
MFGRNKPPENVGKAITGLSQRLLLLEERQIDGADCMGTLDRFFPRCDLCHHRWPDKTLTSGAYIHDPPEGSHLRLARVCEVCCKSLLPHRAKKKAKKKGKK